jgi:sortase A
MKSLRRHSRKLRWSRYGFWALGIVQYGFLVLGILVLGYCAAVLVQSKWFQHQQAKQFAEEIQSGKSASKRPVPKAAPPVPADGAVVGQLAIPRLDLSVIVVQGVRDRDLRLGAGHIPGTALPGQPGNVGIAGHRDTFFRRLRSIHDDDRIVLRTRDGNVRYRVVSTRLVLPDDTQVLYPTGTDSLTLVTCFPFDYIGAAPQRFVVRAVRIDNVALAQVRPRHSTRPLAKVPVR